MQLPGLGDRALRQVGGHGPMRFELAGQRPAVGLLLDLEAGAAAVARVGSGRQRLGPAVAGGAHDPGHPHVEVVDGRSLADHHVQAGEGGVLGLLLVVGDHRDVGVDHRPTDRLPNAVDAVESVAAHRSVAGELDGRDRAGPLALLRALAGHQHARVEAALARARRPVRMHLVQPVQEGAVLVVEAVGLPAQVPRAEGQVGLHPGAHLRPECRPQHVIFRRQLQHGHPALRLPGISRTLRGSAPGGSGRAWGRSARSRPAELPVHAARRPDGEPVLLLGHADLGVQLLGVHRRGGQPEVVDQDAPARAGPWTWASSQRSAMGEAQIVRHQRRVSRCQGSPLSGRFDPSPGLRAGSASITAAVETRLRRSRTEGSFGIGPLIARARGR